MRVGIWGGFVYCILNHLEHGYLVTYDCIRWIDWWVGGYAGGQICTQDITEVWRAGVYLTQLSVLIGFWESMRHDPSFFMLALQW